MNETNPPPPSRPHLSIAELKIIHSDELRRIDDWLKAESTAFVKDQLCVARTGTCDAIMVIRKGERWGFNFSGDFHSAKAYTEDEAMAVLKELRAMKLGLHEIISREELALRQQRTSKFVLAKIENDFHQ